MGITKNKERAEFKELYKDLAENQRVPIEKRAEIVKK